METILIAGFDFKLHLLRNRSQLNMHADNGCNYVLDFLNNSDYIERLKKIHKVKYFYRQIDVSYITEMNL